MSLARYRCAVAVNLAWTIDLERWLKRSLEGGSADSRGWGWWSVLAVDFDGAFDEFLDLIEL